MSNFVVSARKYRPVRFAEVVGQEHVSQTLKNALQNDHLAHAFLFCGPRGVGKTTCARILAKVINCEQVSDDFEPCDSCSSCRSFNENTSFNITELDAASNNSVEHIRALVEQVRFQPQQGRYKVYIIDEVHMLSQSAFNAFLKTLEEPPPYAIFILATTEKHKIIPTILSRCQIFDFRRIMVSDMVQHLQRIAEQEGVDADPNALHIIAQKADGALRDALSIFDRIVSFSGKTVSYDDVIENLNVLDYDYFFQLVDALLIEDMPKVLVLFNEVLSKGFEPDTFINGLAGHLRNLLVCKDAQTLELLEVGAGLSERYAKQASAASNSFLLTALDICNDCDVHYKMARNKRLHTEMALLKMVYFNRAVQLTEPNNMQLPESVEEKKTAESTSPSPIATTADHHEKTAQKKVPPVQSVEGKIEDSTSAEGETNPVVVSKLADTQMGKIAKQYSTGSMSLKAMESALVKEEQTNGKKEIEKLDEKMAQKVWLAYAEKIHSPSLKNTLKSAELKVSQKNIEVSVGSSLAKEMLQQERVLIEYLREELNCQGLTVEFAVDSSKMPKVPKKPKLLTTKEKFDKMRQKNPMVDEMRRRFDLKPDHD